MPNEPSVPWVASNFSTKSRATLSNSALPVSRSDCTTPMRYFPANSPAHATGSRSSPGRLTDLRLPRAANISTIPGLIAGWGMSQFVSLARTRSPTQPSGRKRRSVGQESVGISYAETADLGNRLQSPAIGGWRIGSMTESAREVKPH
jgi:hypothetical protein